MEILAAEAFNIRGDYPATGTAVGRRHGTNNPIDSKFNHGHHDPARILSGRELGRSVR